MPQTRALLLAALLVGCSSNPSPAPLPSPSRAAPTQPGDGPARVMLSVGYSGIAEVERRDSIILTLPDGGRQLQRLGRSARFSYSLSERGELRVRLDSLRLQPSAGREAELIGTTWTGRLTAEGITDVRANRRHPLIGELGVLVSELFPAIPRSGISSGDVWADTTRSKRQVEIFEADDDRITNWSVGRRTTRQGVLVLPVTATATYQQQGEGEQAGREMRMTADGRRSTTYYVTIPGRLDAIVATDTANRLITIPASRQAVPTTQIVRTRVRFR